MRTFARRGVGPKKEKAELEANHRRAATQVEKAMRQIDDVLGSWLMSEMTISINSRPFQVVCRDGEEAQVTQLAEDLAARVADIKKLNERAGDSHLLVLAALTLCSELRDMKREIEAIALGCRQSRHGAADFGRKNGRYGRRTDRGLGIGGAKSGGHAAAAA